jgi:hypothetical protein
LSQARTPVTLYPGGGQPHWARKDEVINPKVIASAEENMIAFMARTSYGDAISNRQCVAGNHNLSVKLTENRRI